MLFAADQKLEHLDDDFKGPGIAAEAHSPEHLFKIAQQGRIGAFATHPGLIARYAQQYHGISYVAKITGKTNARQLNTADPLSAELWSVDEVIALKKSVPGIVGIGCTVYLGSEHEEIMLAQAAHSIMQAHHNGLVTVLWLYPRGSGISKEFEIRLLPGATGVAASLGADFVKIYPPRAPTREKRAELLAQCIEAAGNTKVICSGQHLIDPRDFLEELHSQLTLGRAAGSATGRNIFQRSPEEAIAMTRAISALVYDGASVEEALALLHQ